MYFNNNIFAVIFLSFVPHSGMLFANLKVLFLIPNNSCESTGFIAKWKSHSSSESVTHHGDWWWKTSISSFFATCKTFSSLRKTFGFKLQTPNCLQLLLARPAALIHFVKICLVWNGFSCLPFAALYKVPERTKPITIGRSRALCGDWYRSAQEPLFKTNKMVAELLIILLN